MVVTSEATVSAATYASVTHRTHAAETSNSDLEI